ncbi:MAG: diguanylate cyclase [Methylovulum sp.]|nr:diguanylate cyclase [Methylovulum sp.]
MKTRSKLLIIDDEPINIHTLDGMLRDTYEIIVALNGKQGIKRATSIPPPDLILLDIQMDGMDGYEVCRQLMQNEITRSIPIIFVTSLTDEEDERKGLELGAVDYITKPYRPSIIQVRLRNHLELKHKRDLLNHLCSHDALTGITNRRGLELFLDKEWRRAERYGDGLALIFMDIDHFKNYNDNYGHVAGDECLKEVADILKGALTRSTDLLARYGGEEFVCVLPKTDLAGALLVAQTLRSAILAQAIPHEYSQHNCVSLSFGVVAHNPVKPKWYCPMEFLEAADKMLFKAKKQGRNRIVS